MPKIPTTFDKRINVIIKYLGGLKMSISIIDDTQAEIFLWTLEENKQLSEEEMKILNSENKLQAAKDYINKLRKPADDLTNLYSEIDKLKNSEGAI